MDDLVNQHKDQQDKNELLLWATARGLLPDGAEPGCKDKQGRTPAHYAAAHGHTDVLEWLSTKGVDLDAEDQRGRGPLHYAALGDHAETVEYLCSKGAWVDAPDGADDTPLHLAARGLTPSIDNATDGHADSAAQQAANTTCKVADDRVPGADEKPDVGLADQQGKLRPAARRSYCAAAKALLSAGAKTEVRNTRGLTPLGEAVVSHNPEAVAALLDKKALATVTAQGYTLMHLAAGLGHTACLERIIVEGRRPDTDCADNNEGLTPLHAAVQGGHAAAAKLLLSRGAKASVPDAEGRLPVDYLQSVTSKPNAVDQELLTLKERLERRAGRAATGKVGKAPVSAQAAQSGSTQGAISAEAPTPREKGSVVSSSTAAASQVAAGAGADVTQMEGSGSTQERFRALSHAEQVRKVVAFAKMADADLRLLAFPPNSALPALQALRKAMGIHTCWAAVAAIRQDEQFQEDAADQHVQQAMQDLRTPGVDHSKYSKDRQVQSVFAKLNKLHAVMREHGQGFKIGLEDLRTKKSGPSSVAETLRHLRMLEQKVQAAQDAAIAAVAGLPEQGSTAHISSEITPANDKTEVEADTGAGLQPSSLVGGPLESVKEEEGPRSVREWLWGLVKDLAWHVLRAIGMACLMLSVMWIMGLMPDHMYIRSCFRGMDMAAEQLEAQRQSRKQQLEQALHSQALSAVDLASHNATLDGLHVEF